jgi:hypothetical protein
MRRWALIGAILTAGLSVTVVSFALGGDALACNVSGERLCSPTPVAEELLYGGLALVSVAILTAVVTVARRA